MNAPTPGTSTGTHQAERVKMTMRQLRRDVRAGRKLPMLTCYDATTARWLYHGGIDLLLVGDTAGSVILGYDDTLHAPLPFMLTITAAVKRGAPDAMVIADMPFGSYQVSDEEGVRNALAFMTQGNADVVKLEVDARFVPLVERLDRAGVPVMAHIGWRPQRFATTGVPLIAGKTPEDIKAMVDLAKRLEQGGASMLLIEQCTPQTAERVVEAVKLPVIGCGAGPACHGHVVVLHDWLGLSDRQPGFVKPAAKGGQALSDLAHRWAEVVRSGQYLSDGGPYKLS